MAETNNPNHLKQKADEYIRKHRIVELFEDLCTAICYKQPENIEEFIVKQLQLKKQKGFKMGLFGEEEIRNIFSLFDLKRDGYISKDQCKEALKTLANSQFQVSQIDNANIQDRVDHVEFSRLCNDLLGITMVNK